MKPDALLAKGVDAATGGDRHRARELLTEALRQNPASTVGWLWMSAVLGTPQGRSFCLRQVLAIDPQHPAAQKGLAALQAARPAPVILASPMLDRPVDAERRPGLPPLREVVRLERFWPTVVACLAAIAIGLVGVLAFAAWREFRVTGREALVAGAPSAISLPHSTLRPTFTPTPTQTPTSSPTETATPTPTPTATATPTLTASPTPRPTSTIAPTAKPATRSDASFPTEIPSPTASPKAALLPRVLDQRLPDLGVRVEPAFAGSGQSYWRLVEALWADEQESAGKHNIFVQVLDAQGSRAVGQPVIVEWASGSTVVPMEGGPPPEWGANFPMYNTLGSYTVSVGGAASDRITGLGLGTIEAPDFGVHTCFYLTFRLTHR